jgi:riboflavin synthase
MFTGIIKAIGTIRTVESRGTDKRFYIDTGKLDLTDVSVGDSICVNGVCLTAVKIMEDGFVTDISVETLDCTSFAGLRAGDKVNLEKSLKLDDRLSGHIVIGHVDGVGKVTGVHADARSIRYEIEVPDQLKKYICKKGSVCVDGVSLTINDTAGTKFGVNIIPHTQEETIFSVYREGTLVNIEVDIIARYLEGLMQT